MPYGNVSSPYQVTPERMTFGVGVATYIVAANNSVNKNKADYVCDGVADEVEINQALNALPSNGGSVCLLEGTYSINNSINISGNNIKLYGNGFGTRINVAQNVVCISVASSNRIIICDMYLYGTLGATAGVEITSSTSVIIERNQITTTNDPGIDIDQNSSDIIIAENIIDGCANGINIESNDSMIIGNIIINSTFDGISLQTGVLPLESGYRIIVTNNILDGNGNYGISATGKRHIISNNSIDNNTLGGINLVGFDNNIISENVIYNNGNDGINFAGAIASTNNIINSNQIISNTAYGVDIAVGDNNNIITCNQMGGNGSGAIRDNGAGTEIAHNKT